MHTADLLRRSGGLPSYGNDRNAMQHGQHFGYVRPEPVTSHG